MLLSLDAQTLSTVELNHSGAGTSDILSLASEAGHILLENGAEISRVEETMERISTHYGEDSENFFVLSNGIFTTGRSYANVEFIPIRGARLDKVVEVNRLSREIAKGSHTVEQARTRLGEIRTLPLKPRLERFASAACGCAGFCAIFGGGFMDCMASTVAGLLLYAFLEFFANAHLSKILANICGGLFGAAVCILSHCLGFGENLGNMIIGTLIILIPGVAFTNGLRDIADEDYLAGATRLMDALMVFFCIALGACLAFIVHGWIAGGMIELHGTVTDMGTAPISVQLIAAMLGTTAFSVLFSVPRKYYLAAGAVGMLGWLVYLLIVRHTEMNVVGGTFFAATFVAVLSRYCAVWLKCPSTVFLICGIFPLIPGAGVFWSSYYTVSEQIGPALGAGFTAFKVTIAIVLGIIIAANLPRIRLRRQK